jgi:glycosyltransferase involved in cell wall biosynthesis
VVYREGFSLASRYRLTMVLTRPEPAVHPGIRFVGVPRFASLWQRVLLVHPRLLWHALRCPARLVHLHDPELIPLGLLLVALGRTVVWDVHENVARQVSAKKRNASTLYRLLFRCFNRLAQRHLYPIFAETSYLANYPALRKPHAVVLNYAPLPLLEPFRRKPHTVLVPEFFYIGQLSFARGLDVLIEACARLDDDFPDFRVHLFGALGFDVFDQSVLERIPAFHRAKKHLIFHGYTDARRAFPMAARCLAGLALPKPVGDFPESYPTKLFEYLALGLPAIASDFPLYRAVIEPHGCGRCLDPTSPEALANVLRFFLEQPEASRHLGERGRAAAEAHFAWASQERALFDFYKSLLD